MKSSLLARGFSSELVFPPGARRAQAPSCSCFLVSAGRSPASCRKPVRRSGPVFFFCHCVLLGFKFCLANSISSSARSARLIPRWSLAQCSFGGVLLVFVEMPKKELACFGTGYDE
jgi:hypothetical protein